MTFPRIRAPGMWALGSVIAPSEMEALDRDQSEALDGTAGGTYAPSTPLVIGASGGHFTGPLIADIFEGHVTSGRVLHVDADGSIQVQGTSGHLAAVLIQAFAFIGVASGGTVLWGSGSSGTVQSGATFTIAAGANITAAGSSTYPTGSSLDQQSGALWQLSGTTETESGSFFTVKSGATFAVAAGASSTNASALGVQLTGVAPAVGADPGANVAIGLNQNKGWGSLKSDGVGGVSCPRGMNVANVTVSGSAAGWSLQWARPMDTNDYAITATHRLLPGTPTGPWFAQVELQSSLGCTINIYKHDGSPANVTASTFACGFQIEAKQ